MLKSSTDHAAEQLQVGQIPSKPALNPLFRLDCQNKNKTNPSHNDAAPSKPPINNNVTIQNVSDAVITNSSIVASHSKRDDSHSRSRSRSRQQRTLKGMKGKKRSQESDSERDHIKAVERSKSKANRPKNVGSFSRRSSARLQQRAISQLQSPVQSDTKALSSKSKLNVLESSNTINGISQKREDSANNIVIDKFYKTRICPQFSNGYCDREERCTYAHGEQQIRQFQGACFKTKICYSFTQGRCPKKIEQCRYAHGVNDLRGSKDSQRVQIKMQEQKKSCSPQTNLKTIRKAKIEQHFNRDNNQGRRHHRNKMVDNRKMQEQLSDKQRQQRQRSQKAFLQRQKNRQRQQFSKQSTSSTYSRPDYFNGTLNHQRQVPNVFRQQYQNMPVFGQPLIQSYPLNPQMLNYSLPDFHNYMMQMQMLQYMPQQPLSFYHQYPNYDNGMQPFEFRQIVQTPYPIPSPNYNRGNINQTKKQQPNLSTVDKKTGKNVEKGPEY